MTATLELRCKVSAWIHIALRVLALMARFGVPIDYVAIVRSIAARGVKPIVQRKA